jgi:hypothetical protein
MRIRVRAAVVGVWLVATALAMQPLLPAAHVHHDGYSGDTIVHRHAAEVAHHDGSALEHADHDATARTLVLTFTSDQVSSVSVAALPIEVAAIAPSDSASLIVGRVVTQLPHGPPRPDLPPRAPPSILHTTL